MRRGVVASPGFTSARTFAPALIPTLCLLSGFLKPIRQDVLGMHSAQRSGSKPAKNSGLASTASCRITSCK